MTILDKAFWFWMGAGIAWVVGTTATVLCWPHALTYAVQTWIALSGFGVVAGGAFLTFVCFVRDVWEAWRP